MRHDIHVKRTGIAFHIARKPHHRDSVRPRTGTAGFANRPQRGTAKGRQDFNSRPASRRLRNALVIAEVSLASVLLIGAGLMLRTFLNLIHLDPGFREDHVLTASLSLPHEQYKTMSRQHNFTIDSRPI